MLSGCRVKRNFWKSKVYKSVSFGTANVSGRLEKVDIINKQDLTEIERKKEKANLNKSI